MMISMMIVFALTSIAGVPAANQPDSSFPPPTMPPSPLPCLSSWPNVTECGIYRHSLILDDEHLTGSIPTEIGLMVHLTSLHIKHNDKLAGFVPSEIGLLTNLVELALNGNALNGSLPSELGLLSKLGVLIVSHNDLTGSIPIELSQLSSSLWQFEAKHNELTGTIPDDFEKLTTLTRLVLYSNKIGGDVAFCGDHFTRTDRSKVFRVDCETVACNCCTNLDGEFCPAVP